MQEIFCHSSIIPLTRFEEASRNLGRQEAAATLQKAKKPNDILKFVEGAKGAEKCRLKTSKWTWQAVKEKRFCTNTNNYVIRNLIFGAVVRMANKVKILETF